MAPPLSPKYYVGRFVLVAGILLPIPIDMAVPEWYTVFIEQTFYKE